MSAVIAFDFVEHIIQRIRRTQFHAIVGITSETLRKHSETLITMCSAQDVFSSFSPSLIAAACVMTTLRPLLIEDSSEDNISSTPSSSMQLTRNTPSPSSCSSNSSTPIKSKTSKSSKIPDVNQILDIVQNFTLADKVFSNFYFLFIMSIFIMRVPVKYNTTSFFFIFRNVLENVWIKSRY